MTIHEASEKYNIPIKILREYESWGLCGEVKKIMGSWHYSVPTANRNCTSAPPNRSNTIRNFSAAPTTRTAEEAVPSISFGM